MTPVLVSGQGKVYGEPSYIAYDNNLHRYLAIGSAAKAMSGRSLPSVSVFRPVREGVVADFNGTELLLKHLLRLANPKGIIAPRMVVGVPVDASDVEWRAVAEVARSAGARTVYVVPQLLAAAVGVGFPVLEARGQLVLIVGGETIQAGVVSMGEVIHAEGLRWGSGRFDERLVTFLRNNHKHLVDVSGAEELKIALGTAEKSDVPATGNICGLDLSSGLPKRINLDSNQIAAQLQELLEEISQLIKRVLEATPPELAEDIMSAGCAMCGGGAQLRSLDTYLTNATGVECFVVDRPQFSVVLGEDAILKNPRLLRTVMNRSLVSL